MAAVTGERRRIPLSTHFRPPAGRRNTTSLSPAQKFTKLASITTTLLVFPSLVLSQQDEYTGSGSHATSSNAVLLPLFSAERSTIVTNQAMGARCAVSADFDGDGRLDLVSASSNDNAVSWFRNEGHVLREGNTSASAFSIKKEITWSSLGSRIVTVGDVDGDGDVDVVGASYYDSSLRWFENDGTGTFTEHLISNAVNEGQGVALADLDNDGDPDVASASSGDNSIAVFTNIDRGSYCEVKRVVDDNAIGARTVVAADLNGDGWLDLASASKDDSSVAWYPNDGTGRFPKKIVISSGEESSGAYSLVSADIDDDGDMDLVVASNGNDHVSVWRNEGNGRNFSKTLVFDNADFVLSVTAVDFDRDGDMDIASASFFDGHINWYENVDGRGYEWKNHTIYVGLAGHYVYHGDMDGDGDFDLIAVDHAENTVTVFYAATDCDNNEGGAACCLEGSQWNGTACELCSMGTYGMGSGANAQCVECPTDQCTIPGKNVLPPTCGGITGCVDVEQSLADCACPVDSEFDFETATCKACPEGQVRPDIEEERGLDTLGNYTAWEAQQSTCVVPKGESPPLEIIIPITVAACLIIIGLVYIVIKQNRAIKYHTRDLENAPQDGTISIVFTDVEGSTSLWEMSKDTMAKALEIHHDVIRKVIDRHHAYEVKTIGDSFMVALSSADSAVLLANDIQYDLVNADWPIELAGMPSAGTEFMHSNLGRKGVHITPKAVYKGLRVRIGVHAGVHADLGEKGGQIQAQYDNVAKGYDYYGPVVNAAARIESMAFGGQTLVSDDILTALSKEVKDQCLVRTIGALELKGIENEMCLYQVLPKTLKGRAFKGVFRRRDSDGGSIVENSEVFLSRDSDIMVGGSFLDDEDMTTDVMTLTPIQLQSVVRRLRNRVISLDKAPTPQGRRSSNHFRQSDITTEPFEFNEEISVDERRSNYSRKMSDLDSSILNDTSSRQWRNEEIPGLERDGNNYEFDEAEHVNQNKHPKDKQNSLQSGPSANDAIDDGRKNADDQQRNVEDSHIEIAESKGKGKSAKRSLLDRLEKDGDTPDFDDTYRGNQNEQYITKQGSPKFTSLVDDTIRIERKNEDESQCNGKDSNLNGSEGNVTGEDVLNGHITTPTTTMMLLK